MSRSSRFASAPGDSAISSLTPKALTRQEFGRRVYQLMLAKGWRQSDLARRSGLGRDSISTYIRGRSFPEPVSLQKMAKALGVTSEELLPNTIASAIDAEHPAIELKQATGQPGMAWLRVNRLVSISTAARIIDLLKDEK